MMKVPNIVLKEYHTPLLFSMYNSGNISGFLSFWNLPLCNIDVNMAISFAFQKQ